MHAITELGVVATAGSMSIVTSIKNLIIRGKGIDLWKQFNWSMSIDSHINSSQGVFVKADPNKCTTVVASWYRFYIL